MSFMTYTVRMTGFHNKESMVVYFHTCGYIACPGICSAFLYFSSHQLAIDFYFNRIKYKVRFSTLNDYKRKLT